MSDQALAVLLAVLVYAGMCWWWPHTRCRKCKGRREGDGTGGPALAAVSALRRVG